MSQPDHGLPVDDLLRFIQSDHPSVSTDDFGTQEFWLQLLEDTIATIYTLKAKVSRERWVEMPSDRKIKSDWWVEVDELCSQSDQKKFFCKGMHRKLSGEFCLFATDTPRRNYVAGYVNFEHIAAMAAVTSASTAVSALKRRQDSYMLWLLIETFDHF